MTITITAVANPVYSNSTNTTIDCVLTTNELGSIPYTASVNDSTTYGQALWTSLNNGTYGAIGAYTVTQAQLLTALSTHRYNVCNGGITVGGTTIQTDESSRSDLMGAYIIATNNSSYSVNWKTPAGFVVLNAATIIALGNAVLAFVQKCFSTEATVTINIANYNTVSAVIAAFDTAMA